tara:strand:+ start:1692 stop:2249 length:558 start_codon:yes stop_codon:yes gene_type:complete
MDIVNIDLINLNEDNPRFIKDNKFKKLVNSIRDFPEMLKLRPLVLNEDMVVLGGNMRLKACIHLNMTEVPIIIFTQEMADKANEKLIAYGQKPKTYIQWSKEFLIKDNVGFGEWDWDTLANEWEVKLLNDWGMDVPKFDAPEIEDLSDTLTSMFRLEVETESEEEQEKLYNELIEKGYICRILTL